MENPAPVTPARDSRKKGRNHKNLQAEEDQKMECVEEKAMISLKSLHEHFPKVSLAW